MLSADYRVLVDSSIAALSDETIVGATKQSIVRKCLNRGWPLNYLIGRNRDLRSDERYRAS
jgi:hypothetical protein